MKEWSLILCQVFSNSELLSWQGRLQKVLNNRELIIMADLFWRKAFTSMKGSIFLQLSLIIITRGANNSDHNCRFFTQSHIAF